MRPPAPAAAEDDGTTAVHVADEPDDSALEALINADPGRDDAPVAAPPVARPSVAAPARRSSNPAMAALDRRSETEASFLALCIAFPAAGTRRLADLEVDTIFSSELMRRAALHLRDNTESPSAGLAAGDDALSGLIAELAVRAGGIQDSEPSELERAGLMLELARLERNIAAARATQGPVSELAADRQRVLAEIRRISR